MIMRKRRQMATQEPSGGAPEWMITYSDMVTLLLAFFILLYAYSVLDVQRFQQVLTSIQSSFLGGEGILDRQPLPEEDEGAVPEPGQIEQIVITYEAVRQYLREEGMDGYIRPRIEERGIVLEIEDRILFDSGRAEIREDARQLLAKVSGILKSVPNQIIVEGHTDNVPIKTARYPSNWELSVDRAVHVVRYFIETQHIAPERFIATGYGEYQPVAPNDTAAGRARNRRVNIVISEVNLLDKGADELGSTGEESK